jgi:hypothetical protein
MAGNQIPGLEAFIVLASDDHRKADWNRLPGENDHGQDRMSNLRRHWA